MLKKYAIHEENEPPVGYLYYDTETDLFELEVLEDINLYEMPAFMYFMRQYNKLRVKDDLARAFVKERLIPPERQNIAQILADLRLPYYDEVLMLEVMRGRCVMDEFLIDLIE